MQEINSIYDLVKHFAEYTSRSVFLTGRAGTGKTTFLYDLKSITQKQIAVVAPTGVAAIHAGGVTMHSFFQLPFTPYVPTPEGRKHLLEKIKMTSLKRKIIQELELLVIDEISMVRADVLDAVDTILRYVRYRRNEAFGGVQILFIGDMYQLAPVAQNEEWRLLSPYYQTPYFFHSKAVAENPPLYIEFDKIYRQKNQSFINLLNEVRNNQLSDKGMELLLSRFKPNFKLSKKNNHIVLTTHNAKADRINAEEMLKVKGKTHRFEAIIKGEFPERSYPNELVLELKEGAKVMFISNDKSFPRRYYNGKIGEVSRIEEERIYVRCEEDEEEILVVYETWSNVRYAVNPESKQIEEEELGSYTQYPLRLAWAITIHKSQGLTFDKVMIDAEAAFTSGQVYVALSRCRSLEGLVLLSPIYKESLTVDKHIVNYTNQKSSLPLLSEKLEEAKKEFNYRILFSIFDYKLPLGQLLSLQSFVKEHEKCFNAETLPFIDELLKQLLEIDDIVMKFQRQLTHLLHVSHPNDELIKERIRAAATYFIEQTEILIKKIHASPAESDYKEKAYEYNDLIRTIFSELVRKTHILKGIKNDYTTPHYFKLKKEFKMPSFKVNAYVLFSNVQKEKSKYPDLYRELNYLRSEIAEENDFKSINLVISTKALLEMLTYLPQTLADLKLIRGFSKKKIEMFGQDFVDIIRFYCRENGLESNMQELREKKRKK